MIDLQRDQDLDRVAQIAYELAERLRDEDLRELHEQLVELCRWHPAKAAQIIACLAAWLDPETPTTVLWQRVEAVTDTRMKAALARQQLGTTTATTTRRTAPARRLVPDGRSLRRVKRCAR